MKNLIVLILIVLVQYTCASAQTNSTDSQKEYVDRLQGKWASRIWVERDKKFTSYPDDTIIFNNNKVLIINGKDTARGTFVYNARKSPHWLDYNIKFSTGQSGKLYGIIEWIDDATIRTIILPESKVHITAFEDDPDLDKSFIMRKQGVFARNTSSNYLKDYLTMGKWDITLLYEAEKYSPHKKHQTITFKEDNRYILTTLGLTGYPDDEGRYEINTSQSPYWLDLYSDRGGKTLGLIQEYLYGYKFQTFKILLTDKHPVQFTDVEFGSPSMINFNPDFLYLQRSAEVQETAKPSEISGEAVSVVESPNDAISKPGEVITDREGNTYKTIVLSNGQHWMAENLRYLPGVVGPGTGSNSVPYYYVYDYNGNSVADAKATANYQNYGALYNWTAAVNACPAGWHLPSAEEWKAMEDYFISKGFNYDGTTTEDKLAKSLAAVTGWTAYTKEGAIGSGDYPSKRNISGFNALPGGTRSADSTFASSRAMGVWWSASESSEMNSEYRLLAFSRNYVFKSSFKKESGYSVRCVKD